MGGIGYDLSLLMGPRLKLSPLAVHILSRRIQTVKLGGCLYYIVLLCCVVLCCVVLVMICCSAGNGCIEHKDDVVHDFWLIVDPTNHINGNQFPRFLQVSNVPFASPVSSTEKT